MKLSEYVSIFRKAHGYSLRKMAELCDCSFQQIAKIENDEVTNPTLQMLRGIADGTNISIHELLTILDDMDIHVVEDTSKVVNSLQMQMAQHRMQADLEEQILLERYGIVPDESYAVAKAFRNASPNVQSAIKLLLGIKEKG